MQAGVSDQINTHGGEHAEGATIVVGGERALAALGLSTRQEMVRDQVAALALGIRPDGQTRLGMTSRFPLPRASGCSLPVFVLRVATRKHKPSWPLCATPSRSP
jgi:hypothetical protein